MSSQIMKAILTKIEDNGGEVQGTEHLTLELTTINCLTHVRNLARRLQDDGEIVIIPSSGGRGNKAIYKRNRNQPGLPRKVR